MKAYEEIIEFIAAGTSPQTIVGFKPSQSTKLRVSELIDKEKQNAISPEEQSELNHFLEMEHLIKVAKSRARQHLQNA